MKRCFLPCLTSLLCSVFIHQLSFAQIGYQVSLLDKETGQPRVNETVGVTVEITDSQGSIIISENQQSTTDEFGTLSLTIGDADSFKQVNWNNLPLWVSAKVDDIVISKSQILNVPVAEYAKSCGPLTKKILCSKTWYDEYGETTLNFSTNGGLIVIFSDHSTRETGTYNIIQGRFVLMKTRHYSQGITRGEILIFNEETGALYGSCCFYK